MYFEVGAIQIQGGRDYQEDYFQVSFPQETEVEKTEALLVMADGMGGHAGGAVASQIVVDAIMRHFEKQGISDQVTTNFRQSLDAANQKILERVRKQPELQGMGCTLVGVILREDSLQWVSVGDSLLYVIRGDEVIRKNDDHSYGGYIDKLQAAGEPIPETPGFTPRRNMLMSYINGEEIAMIDIPFSAERLAPGDRIIIASDGLDTISRNDFPYISRAAKTAQEFAEGLIAAVEAAGKKNQDNTTVIVADVLGEPLDSTGSEAPGDWAGDTLQPVEDPTLNPAEIDEEDSVETVGLDDTLPPTAVEEIAPETAESPSQEPPEATRSAEEPEEQAAPEFAETDTKAVDQPATEVATATDPAEPVAEPAEPEAAAETADAPPEPDSEPATTADAEVEPETRPDEAAIAAVAEPAPAGEKQGLPGYVIPAAVGAAALLAAGGFFLLGGHTDADSEAPQPAPGVEPAPPTATPTPPEPTVEPAEAPAAPRPVVVERLHDPLRGGGMAPRLVIIPAGGFEMGSPEHSLNFDERPRHSVQVPRFAIGAYEVTFAEYERFAAATGRDTPKDSGWGRDRRPVINVSWQDAAAYTAWLSEQTGYTYRLPTEAEWEYAARAGSTEDFWWGPVMEPGMANCWGCGTAEGGNNTAPVGSHEPNAWGAADTVGNVAEWVMDCHHPTYTGAPADGSAWVEPDCPRRVVRGGSWNNTADSVRVAKRTAMEETARRDFIGFRVARELE